MEVLRSEWVHVITRIPIVEYLMYWEEEVKNDSDSGIWHLGIWVAASTADCMIQTTSMA